MTLVNIEIADRYQEFFDFMQDEHGLILTIEEMDEIINEAQKHVEKTTLFQLPNFVKRKVCRCYEVPPKKDFEKCDTCGKPYQYRTQT